MAIKLEIIKPNKGGKARLYCTYKKGNIELNSIATRMYNFQKGDCVLLARWGDSILLLLANETDPEENCFKLNIHGINMYLKTDGLPGFEEGKRYALTPFNQDGYRGFKIEV